jgi:hypothetical protein
MQIHYDEDLVESAVFVCVSGRRPEIPSLQINRFHREREKLYAILDPDERNAAFFKLHLSWFREWNLEQALTDRLDEYPALRASLAVMAFRRTSRRHEEGAELYVNLGIGNNGVLALRAERFAFPVGLEIFLRHEFMHLHDMIDPAFGYSPQLHEMVRDAMQQRLTRERYRLLWDITIDGRLSAASDVRKWGRNFLLPADPPPHAGVYSPTVRDLHRAAFDRAFGFWPQAKRDETFDSLWRNRSPRHAELMAIASDPRDLRSASAQTPGAPCPLCGFATFDWADTSRLGEGISAAIRREFPHWTADQGACGRCVEIFHQLAVQSEAIV